MEKNVTVYEKVSHLTITNYKKITRALDIGGSNTIENFANFV